MSLEATLNQPVTLAIQTTDGNPALFARALLYNSIGGLVATVSLPAVTGGLYQAQYVPGTLGYFATVYETFLDSLFTMPSGYEIQAETLEVSTDSTNLMRVLGLLNQNTFIDSQIYDSNGNMTSCRIRNYDSSANATTQNVAGLLYTWNVTAVYNGQGRLIQYLLVTVP